MLHRLPLLTHPTCRLALVFDSPHREEQELNRHLVHYAGQCLTRWLGAVALTPDHCFIGYANSHVSDDDYSESPSPGMLPGTLLEALVHYRPNVVLALGKTAASYLLPHLAGHNAKLNLPTFDLESHRGSIYTSTYGFKVIPSYSPSFINQAPGELPFLKRDIRKAKEQSAYPEVREVIRDINIHPTFDEVCAYLSTVGASPAPVAFDVEGYNDNVGVTMYSIARSPSDCIVVPFWIKGTHSWSLEEESVIWQLTAAWLTNPNCPKIVTNAMYELFILAWKHNITIVNIADDTMFKQWELFPELPKSLASQTSYWTEQPYYKQDRTSDDPDVKLRYNGLDSCMSFECNTAQDSVLRLQPRSAYHYHFNIRLIPTLGYIQLRGCRFDAARASAHSLAAEAELATLQPAIDGRILQAAVDAGICTRKRKSDPYHFNVKSPDQKAWLLYDYFGYKPYARLGKTTKEEVLLRYYAKDREPLLKTIIQAISIRTRISDINKLTYDTDGRIRSNFNLVGTDTGRLSSSASNAMRPGEKEWEWTGTNLQNVTKELRDCFVPDSDEHAFFECDLSGADGWTVAADLAALGHPTMLDDYLAGIKPAKVLLLMLAEHESGRDPASINKLDRQVLRKLTNEIKFPKERDAQGRQGDWKYLCMKRVQHGSNYGMQPELLSATIFKDSEGTIDLTSREAGLYQWLYKIRYNPEARTQWLTRELGATGKLGTAAGISRQFFGLRNPRSPDPAVVRSALSFEPQANTTYATNLALEKLWYNPANRTSKHSLFIEPLLLVHDAIGGQFKRSNLQWVSNQIHTAFANDLTIHGIKIRIPFEGGYGTSWRDSHSQPLPDPN